MDRKSLPILILCFALLLLLPKLANWIFPPQPLPPGATNQVPAAVSVTAPAPGEAPPPVTPPPATPAATTSALARPEFPPAGKEELLVLENENARYTFTSHGGGLKRIELLRYPETVSRASRKQPLTNNLAELNTLVSVPVLAILGDASVQGDGVFALKHTATGVRAEKILPNGLRWVKEFQPTTNFLVAATVWLENTTRQPLTVPAQEWIVGTATPMGPKDDVQNIGLMWYDGAGKEEIALPWFENLTLGCFAGVPRPEYRAGQSNVVWASAHNQFFALVAMPREPAQQIVSVPVTLPRPDDEVPSANGRPLPPPKGMQTALAYPALTLAPGQTLERQFHFFAGPKEYRTLARLANRFQNNVDLVMGFGGFFGFFSKALLLGMNWLHYTFHLGYGLAIIVITIIIKLLFWPLTLHSTRSMKRMAALQPQMKALQEKYKDDPAKMNKKLMEFMKENKVSPLGGCLPMLLQMPVFIGFFYMIRSAIELRGAPFLWVPDLSKPDTLFHVADFPFNLLPLLMGATMLWQARLTPPSPGMDPTQQKIMKYLPLMFMVFLYNFSAGLTLYWTVQNLLTILQTKVTKTSVPDAPPPPSPLTPAAKRKK